jgi:2'-5' RNA ligase
MARAFSAGLPDLPGPPAASDESLMTVGVAIAIPEPHATLLANWRRRVGDPQASRIPTHVTLLPPTELSPARLAEVERHLKAAAGVVGPFTMRLAGTGTFRPVSQVVFVQVSAGIVECELLERAVRSSSLAREAEFPYHPHVTIAHDIDDAGLDAAFEGLQDFVAQFQIHEFVLFTRTEDGGWNSHRSFPLSRR